MPGFSNNTMYAGNVDFTGNANPAAQVTADGQLLIGATVAPNIRVATPTNGNNVTWTLGAGSVRADVTGTTNHSILLGNATGSISSLGAATNGQIAIGSTGADPVLALPTNGSNISWTGGAGTLTANLSGTTNHSLQLGNVGGSLTSLGAATNGQIPIGSTGADPVLALPTNGNNISWTGGAGTLTANVTGTTDHAIQLGNAGGSLTSLGVATNGQIPIGSTGANPVLATISAGAGISVTNAAGSITIGATGGGLTWATVGAGGAFVVNNGYVCTGGAGLSFSLPATSAVGDMISITLDGSASWTITQAAGQQIRLGNAQTTGGVGGSLASTAQGDTITMVCSVANTKWNVISCMGNITIV